MSEAQAQSVEQAEQAGLLKVIESFSPAQLRALKKMLEIPETHKRKKGKHRDLTAASRRAMLAGVDASHADDFIPAFPEDIHAICEVNPEVKAAVLEIWEEGKCVTHTLLEQSEELLDEYPVLLGEFGDSVEDAGPKDIGEVIKQGHE